jgi:hypothetical protein
MENYKEKLHPLKNNTFKLPSPNGVLKIKSVKILKIKSLKKLYILPIPLPWLP